MVMRTLFACCLTPAVVCGAGGCVRCRRLCVVPVLCRASGAVLRQRLACCGNGWRVALAAVVCGAGAVSCFRRCVAATAGVLRCLDCVWQRQMCAVPAVVCTSGAVLWQRQMCTVPAVVCRSGGGVAATAGVLRCGVVCGDGAVLRQRLACCGAVLCVVTVLCCGNGWRVAVR